MRQLSRGISVFLLLIITFFLMLLVGCDFFTETPSPSLIIIHPNNGECDTEWTVTSPFPDFSKDGYILDGYYSDENLVLPIDLNSLEGITDIFLKWKKICPHHIVFTEKIAPTCTESGYTASSYCDDCGRIFDERKELTPLGHQYLPHEKQPPSCAEIGWDSYETCSRCDYTTYLELSPLGHSESDWIIDENATCLSKGAQHTYCLVCLEILQENTIDFAEHILDEWEIAAYPSCMETGSQYKECTVCSTIITTETIAELGHDCIRHEKCTPTCTTIGWEEFLTCSRCEYTTYIELPFAEHILDKWITESIPSCTKVGIQYKECSSCKERILVQEIPAKGHIKDSWRTEKRATCIEYGLRYRECYECSIRLEEEPISPLGHSIISHNQQKATCTTIGWENYDTCSRCNYTTYNELQPLGHSKSEWIVDAQPDCTTEGLEHITCLLCNEVLERHNISALGHNKVVDAGNLPNCLNGGMTDGEHCERCLIITIPQIALTPLGHNISLVPSKKANCTEIGWESYETCSRCDYTTYSEISPLGHTSGGWITDSPSTCDTEGSKHKECTICKTVLTTSATIVLGHLTITDKEVSPDCTNSGLTVGSHCKRCATILVPQQIIPPLGHYCLHNAGKSPTCLQDGWAEYDTCSRCDYTTYTVLSATGHIESSWIIDENATCTANGQHHKECNHCKILLSQEVIYAFGHIEVIDVSINPDCTNAGLTEGKHCSRCSSILLPQEEIKALGHITSQWVIDENPTCVLEGERHNNCTRCTIELSRESISPLGHTESDWIIDNNPDCTEIGHKHIECTICYTELHSEDISALGHTASEWIYDENPTCVLDGERHNNCIRCTIELSRESISPLGHTESDWIIDNNPDCTEIGHKHIECTICYTELHNEDISALGHTAGEWIYDENPTCVLDGERHNNCIRCTIELSRENISAFGHTMSDWNTTKSPTCTQEGERQQLCLTCGDGITEKIAKTAHSYQTTNHEATCISYAYTHYECINCEYNYDYTAPDAQYGDHNFVIRICTCCSIPLMELYREEFRQNIGCQVTNPYVISGDNYLTEDEKLLLYWVWLIDNLGEDFLPLEYVCVKLQSRQFASNDEMNTYLKNSLYSAVSYNYTVIHFGLQYNHIKGAIYIYPRYIYSQVLSGYVDTKYVDDVHPADIDEDNVSYACNEKDPDDWGQCPQFVNPEVVDQEKKRVSDFDDFGYYNRPYCKTVKTSDQLFYAFQSGYCPIPVADSSAESILNKAKNILRQIITDDMTDKEKLLSIYLWFINEIVYDSRAIQISSVDYDSFRLTAHFADGVFDYNMAVCDGIAKAVCILVGIENIPCIYATGFPNDNGDGHAWNKVYIDGDEDGTKEWYAMDCTQTYYSMDRSGKSLSFYTFRRFLFTDTVMATQYPDQNNFGVSATTPINPYNSVYYGSGKTEQNDLYFTSFGEITNYLDYLYANNCYDQKGKAYLQLELYIDYDVIFNTFVYDIAYYIYEQGIKGNIYATKQSIDDYSGQLVTLYLQID